MALNIFYKQQNTRRYPLLKQMRITDNTAGRNKLLQVADPQDSAPAITSALPLTSSQGIGI